MNLEEAREKVAHLAESEAREEEEGEHEPGKKEAWILKGSEFKSVALQTDRFGKVSWVTGFIDRIDSAITTPGDIVWLTLYMRDVIRCIGIVI